MDGCEIHFETMGNHNLCWYYRRIIIPGFLRWCRILSIHGISKERMGDAVWSKEKEEDGRCDEMIWL